MDLALVTTEHEGVSVLAASGELDLATLPRFRDRLMKLVADHPGEAVAVDLDGVASLDDTAFGVLLGARRRLRAGGGELHLVLADERLRALLEATGLDTLFPIHATLSSLMGVLRGT